MDIQVSQIDEGQNPRKYFDPAEMEELQRSIAAIGILQPISVKEAVNDRYVIVAGHRRFMAAKALGLPAIPAHVLPEDVDTDAAALVENTVRADMSPAEECDAAGIVMKRNKGDLAETALALGWTESKLRRRLALSACSAEVRQALAERKIKLGIAELLATVPDAEKQNKALKNIIEHDLSVDAVRASLARLTQKLASAIFDKTECQTCQFNTAEQSTLFSEVLSDDAYCTNAQCFGAKTRTFCESKVDGLKSEYPLVRLLVPENRDSSTKLFASGAHGVGAKQINLCHQCANYGATVSVLPGSEGAVEDGICFDLQCNGQMVAAYQAELASAAQAANEEKAEAKGKPSEPKGSPVAKGTAATSAVTARPKVALSGALQTYRRGVWNSAAMRFLSEHQDRSLPLVVAVIAAGGRANFNGEKLNSVLRKKVGDLPGEAGGIAGVLEQHAEQKDVFITMCAVSCIENLSEHVLQDVLGFLGVDLGRYWSINGDYLSLLTKAEIISVVNELCLEEKIPDWKKKSSGKKQEVIDCISNGGIDFTGMIPANMRYSD